MGSENEQMQLVCRTCLAEKEDMKCIFNVADVIMTCAQIQIEQGDGLPTTICTECAAQANQAYEFRLLCEQSDNVLRKRQIQEHMVLIKTDRYDVNSPEPCIDTCYNSPIDEKEDVPLKLENVGNSLSVQNSQDDIENYTNENADNGWKRTSRKLRAWKKESCENITEDIVKEENRFDSESSESSEGADSETELCCRYCDMKFRYKVRLKKHEQKHKHGLKCHICEKDFPTIKQLTNHINIHSRKGSHLCQTCGKQFTLPENLVRHQRIHTGVRPYKCQLCSKSFTQSNELKSHLVTHSSEKHHLCSVCGNKYSRSISLRVHMRRIHSIPPNHRPYICTVCGRNFKDRRDLAQHMLIHTGERSHVCKVCNKAFNRSSNLRVHERIHSGHKPHVCPVCQRAFIQKHVLNTHMRTHPKST